MVKNRLVDVRQRPRRLGTLWLLLFSGLFVVGCSMPMLSSTPKSSAVDDASISPEAGVELGAQTQATFPDATTDLERYEGLPVGFTEEGYPFRGDPAAPLTLVEYSDYLCPFCALHQNRTLPGLLDSYGTTGQLNFVYRDFPLASLHPQAPQGHAAALCVAEQGAALFWAMHDELFRTQGEWGGQGNPAPFLAGLAEAVGADMTAYEACMSSGRTEALVAEHVADAEAQGFNSTPNFQLLVQESGRGIPISGAQPEELFASTIDALLAGEILTAAKQPGSDARTTRDPDELTSVTFDFDEALDTYGGLPVGFTEEGYPFLGNPEAAVSLVEFSDYLCPFCSRHFSETSSALLERYGASGEANFVFRDFPLASLHPTAHVGHEAALCVGEQGAALYWQMHDQLFARQSQWANLPDPTEFLGSVAAEVGADTESYTQCMTEGRYTEVVQERVAEGEALGFTGTPTFQVRVNETGDVHQITGAQSLDVFTAAMDALIAGEEIPEPEEPEPAELPFWASAEGLAPDPEREGFTTAGDPFKGNPEAEVVVVEFADFQCPPCQEHALSVQPALDAALVDTGEIMWVFKALPLQEHEQALSAAVAAECAGDQGQFWEMHDRLFESVDTWAVEDEEAPLLTLAEEVGLDTAAFSTCYNGRDALERVVNDMYDAQGVAEQTPTFVVLQDGRGGMLSGSRSADEFEELIRTRLEERGDETE